jgi:hypothetical protein
MQCKRKLVREEKSIFFWLVLQLSESIDQDSESTLCIDILLNTVHSQPFFLNLEKNKKLDLLIKLIKKKV